MAITEQRLRQIEERLRGVLLPKHPRWADYIRLLVRWGLANTVDAGPAVIDPERDLAGITPAQKLAFKVVLKNALASDDQSLIDEAMP